MGNPQGQRIEPMPSPVTVGLKIVQWPQPDGLIPKKLLAIEFFSFTGVSVYFFDQDSVDLLAEGLKDKFREMRSGIIRANGKVADISELPKQ